MTRLPALTDKKIIAALKKAGVAVLRVKGSHHFLRHPDGRTTLIPVHSGETLGSGLVQKILHDCQLTPEEFAASL